MDLVNHLTDRMLFAVPKKGRLYEKCVELLNGLDIQFRRLSRLDIALSTNLPIALIFLPAADIPMFVADGKCDLGITGVDQVKELDVDVELLMDLGFGNCKLQLQVPVKGEFNAKEQLVGKTIVSLFTRLTTEYFMQIEGVLAPSELKTRIRHVGGSVEASCALGIADGIVDLVESGETMRAAGLTDIDTVLSTLAYLIASKHPRQPEMVRIIQDRILGVLTAQKYKMVIYNAPRSILKSVLELTPGRRAATVSPLEEDDWVAVSSMVERKNLGNVMDQLKLRGAVDILVLDIHNSRV